MLGGKTRHGEDIHDRSQSPPDAGGRRRRHAGPGPGASRQAAAGHAALGDHRSAARFLAPAPPPAFSPDPDMLRVDPVLRRPVDRPGSDPAPPYRPASGRRPGLVAASACTPSSATSRTTRSIAISGRPARSRCSAGPPSPPTATASIFQGRQLSTQDFFRRVVRWEADGSMTVLADQFDGKPLNSPNDLAPHKDGSVWFTDPQFGGNLAEGHPDDGDGPMNARRGARSATSAIPASASRRPAACISSCR